MAVPKTKSPVESLGSKTRSNDALGEEKPWLDNVLTVVFFAFIIDIIHNLSTRKWSGNQQLLELFASLPIMACFIVGSKSVAHRFFYLVAHASACKRKRNARKFADQAWQLMIHVSMTIYEIVLLYPGGVQGGMDWFYDTKLCYIGPGGAYEEPPNVWLERLYIMQASVWIYTLISHRWLEEKHKDYYMMFAHHVVTIGLIALSWKNTLRIGMLILFAHDASDVGIDLLKMFNYMGRGSENGFPFTEIIFIIGLVAWTFFRLYLFPFYLLRSAIFESAPSCEDVGISCTVHRVSLIVLQGMHIWWTYLLLKILISGITHKAGAEAYEGDSTTDREDKHK